MKHVTYVFLYFGLESIMDCSWRICWAKRDLRTHVSRWRAQWSASHDIAMQNRGSTASDMEGVSLNIRWPSARLIILSYKKHRQCVCSDLGSSLSVGISCFVICVWRGRRACTHCSCSLGTWQSALGTQARPGYGSFTKYNMISSWRCSTFYIYLQYR